VCALSAWLTGCCGLKERRLDLVEVRAFQSFGFSSVVPDSDVIETSFSPTQITSTSDIGSGIYRGNFTYDESNAVFGQLESYSQTINGQLAYEFLNINFDAYEFFQALQFGSQEALVSDVFMGPDTFYGSTQSDILNGYSGDDSIFGNNGNDIIIGGSGDDTISGGAGYDVAGYFGNQSSHTLTLSSGSTTISDRRVDGDGTDTLIDIEALNFNSGSFDLTQFGGTTGLSAENFESFIELYIAYFNRAPDAIGLNFWGTAFANGTTLEEMATLFIDQDETLAAYPPGTSNSVFAETVYNNVLGRTPDQTGFDFWVDQLDSGSVSRDQFILNVLQGAKSDLKPELGQDFVDQQLADQEFLTNKTDIGAYFAVHKGMSDVDNASSAMALFDGTDVGIDAAVAAIDGHYADALDPANGEFLMQVVGVLDDPFAGV